MRGVSTCLHYAAAGHEQLLGNQALAHDTWGVVSSSGSSLGKFWACIWGKGWRGGGVFCGEEVVVDGAEEEEEKGGGEGGSI